MAREHYVLEKLREKHSRYFHKKTHFIKCKVHIIILFTLKVNSHSLKGIKEDCFANKLPYLNKDLLTSLLTLLTSGGVVPSFSFLHSCL